MKYTLLVFIFFSLQSFGQRSVISLNGLWEVEDGIEESHLPSKYTHRVNVPGLTNLSIPGFKNIDNFTTVDVLKHPIIGIKDNPALDTIKIGIVGQERNYFWYRNNFSLPEKKEKVVLKINKAQFGTSVWINGENVGDHYGCFTAGIFDITGFVHQSGDNEIVIRIGAHPKALPEWVPYGTDLEKRKWTPGIYDDVSIISCNNPYIETLQVAPDINNLQVKVQTKITGIERYASISINYKIKEWKTGVEVASLTKNYPSGNNDFFIITDSLLIPDSHLWSPDDPFLYKIEVSTKGDHISERFGMREFHFDNKTKKAYLNNKIIYLRGSNICLHRFFEDSLCQDNPWNEEWVRRLLQEIPKEMHWNSFRFCIGPVPSKWLDIADEAGLLIQNEFFMWTHKDYWKIEEFENQVGEWMRDNWNHPSLVIWDMQNETRWDKLEEIIIKFRKLDLSGRPWENGWSKPADLNDPVEDHNYLNYYARSDNPISPWNMPTYAEGSAAKGTNSFHPTANPTILNEYAWMWLNRNGEPTILSKDFYNRVAPGYNRQQLQDLYGYFLAGETEYFRAFRNYAGIQFFTYLTADYPQTFTCDLFEDIKKLKLNETYKRYMIEAFKPLGIYLHFWEGIININKDSVGRFPIMVINDEYRNLKGRLEIRIEKENGEVIEQSETTFFAPELTSGTYLIDCAYPSLAGEYFVKAIAYPEDYESGSTTSIRKLKIIRE